MALINCEECGHEISTNTARCPNCGNEKESFNSVLLWCAAPIVFCLVFFGGYPVEFSIILAVMGFSINFLLDKAIFESFLPREDFRNSSEFWRKTTFISRCVYLYIIFLSFLSFLVMSIIFFLSMIYYFMDFGYTYDVIYEIKEVLLGVFLVLPLLLLLYFASSDNWLSNYYLYDEDDVSYSPTDSSPDEIPTNPYTPLEDKNLLIQNIIEITGKNSWKAELEKLDVDTLNTFLEKLSRGENLDK